jgi:magnesium chelatase family protein
LVFDIPQFDIVELINTNIKKNNKRILTTLKNNNFKIPAKKIIVNLAPANLKKKETIFDLPIALAIVQMGNFLFMTTKIMEKTLLLEKLSIN